MKRLHCDFFVVAIMLLAIGPVGVAPAQGTQPATQQGGQNQNQPAGLLDDFIHYTMIARPELASGSAEALFNTGITNVELARLVDEGAVEIDRFNTAIIRAQRMDAIADLAAELETRVEEGRLELAREAERIEQAIEMLVGTMRQRMIAEERLQAAGEYAVPALLRRIVEGRDQRMRLRCEAMLRKIGRQAAYPLSVALLEIGDATGQRIIADVLGDIGYPIAGPYLMELAERQSTTEAVREAARRSLDRVWSGPTESVSMLYTMMARRYFNESNVLIANPLEETNIVWSYDPFGGLSKTMVATEIFSEVRAMQMTRTSLEFDRDSADALSLFVAANLRRENEMPADQSDPIFGDMRYSPAFYATVFGTQTCLDVLAMALDADDTALVRDAQDALAQTTGGSNLFNYDNDQGRSPLVESLEYPDRQVQYDAAMILGKSLPSEGFAGDFRVVPLLASAVRSGGRNFALVIADNAEDRRVLGNKLEAEGFEIVGASQSAQGARGDIDAAIGVDLIAVRRESAEAAMRTVDALRNIAKTSVAPVLVFAEVGPLQQLQREYRDEVAVKISRPGLNDQQFNAALTNLLDVAAGGRLDEARAEVYAIEALDVLEDIAIADSPIYNIRDAEVALLEALQRRYGGVRDKVAGIVARIDTPQAQRTLFDTAMQASEEADRVSLFTHTADSVKRFGNHLQERHIANLLDLVRQSEGDLAEAAARLHGALNLPTHDAVELIGL